MTTGVSLVHAAPASAQVTLQFDATIPPSITEALKRYGIELPQDRVKGAVHIQQGANELVRILNRQELDIQRAARRLILAAAPFGPALYATPRLMRRALFHHAAPQFPRRANPSKAAILHSDRTQAERPLQRSATLLKTLAQPAILSPQSGTAPRGPLPPLPPRRPGTKPPATIHEQPPRLSPARTIAPIVPQTDPAQPDAWVNPPALSPAVAEPPRQQAAPLQRSRQKQGLTRP